MKATREDAYRLLHEGSQVLARMEHNGIRVDEAYLDAAIVKVKKGIKKAKRRLESDEAYTVWKKAYGSKMNLNSRPQLGDVLFNRMGFKSKAKTATGKPSTDDEALKKVGSPFTKAYLDIARLQKTESTYLRGIKRELVNGFLHCSFNLHRAASYRSSSSDPNFQNFPIRDPIQGEMIRRMFIPRGRGRSLVEIDYGGIEVRIAACYHKDPRMLRYIKDPTTDMHRDMAIQCYKLKDVPKEWWKQKGSGGGYDLRYAGKNCFVFPEFYGSYYIDCAKNLWDAISTFHMTAPNGRPLRKHLKAKGISKLGRCIENEEAVPGTFEHHIKEVEKDFWEVRFPVYKQWRDDWYAQYRKLGYLDMFTGFRCSGLLRRNEVINLPVQGAAFHCLLWAAIEIQKELIKQKMKAKLVGQIHDSILGDVPNSEIPDYLALCKEIMTKRLVKAWDWIIVPLEIEADVAPDNWWEKKGWHETGGTWKARAA